MSTPLVFVVLVVAAISLSLLWNAITLCPAQIRAEYFHYPIFIPTVAFLKNRPNLSAGRAS